MSRSGHNLIRFDDLIPLESFIQVFNSLSNKDKIKIESYFILLPNQLSPIYIYLE